MIRVLLVDDDLELCSMQGEYLSNEGFAVQMCHDGESGLEEALSGDYDLILLDVMMPKLNGIDVLRRLRIHSNIPVLMLTAKGDDIDRIIGLELGADDYVSKPCTPRELVARVRAILRRADPEKQDPGQLQPLRVGALAISAASRSATWRDELLDLTSTEFNLLEMLCRRAGRTISKEDLSLHTLGRPLARYDRSIDVHVSNLRQKLGTLKDGRSPIQTIRGIGYQLVVE
ncbi:response regulator transcription factor [Tolumonas lignilytica]|jgi:Response regulators consisting of a CheY-like receiver domain and a winged-helix DNA-binding domain|uniref:response regulator transcription factor n=1 Tax=Tolumonas lignilytica TaxID=1283284 RepID=UPI000464C7B7|nr:response regulator transcription factor [Tolumonas lignilytica]